MQLYPICYLRANRPTPPREKVDQLANAVQGLSRRLDQHEDTVVEAIQELSTELDALHDELDGTTPPGGSAASSRSDHEVNQPRANNIGSQSSAPRRWAARATQQDWDSLIEWVDQLRNEYSLSNGYVLAPCWPVHPGVVEELAALYRAWTNAVLVDEQAGSEGSSAGAAWHDRWLWPTLHRVNGVGFRITNCRETHVTEASTPAKPTVRPPFSPNKQASD